MCTKSFGEPIAPNSMHHSWLLVREAAGVPHMRLRDLPHSHVSLLERRGLDPRTIADRIGHSDVSFTMRRYSHMFDEHRKAAAVSLADLFGPTGETN